MSFYGTVYYQIANAFASFYINNSGKVNNTSFIDSSEVTNNLEIAADGRDGFVTFDSGNRWIGLVGDPAANTCTFYHAAADTNNLTLESSFLLASSDEVSGKTPISINLSQDVYLKTKTISYDKAGHISTTGLDYFKIPQINIFSKIKIENNGSSASNFLNNLTDVQISSNGVNDIFKIDSGNKWIQISGDTSGKYCKIYHNKSNINNITNVIPFIKIEDENTQKTIENNKNYIELNLDKNVYLKANIINYDEAGHAYGTSFQYFKIPLVETSEILSDHEQRIKNFEAQVTNRVNSFENNVTSTINAFSAQVESFDGELVDINSTLVEHADSISTINSTNSTQTTNITNLQNLCGKKSNFTANNGVNLCNGIGNIDYLRNNGKNSSDQEKLAMSLSDLNEKTNPTLCDYINALKKEIISLGNTSTKVITLETEINKIKAKLGME